uniref:Uncharacterized protein n=1 Tax=Ciona intestinalis TaxID=7719 RepID=F6QC95_CIOIN
IVLLILYCAEQLSAIQLPQPGNQANVATGTTNLMITATVTTSPSSCTWSGTGLTSTEFYSSAFGRCKTLTPTATHSITCTNVPGGFSTSLTYLTAMTSNASVSLICGSVASVVYSLSMIVKVNPSSGVYNTRANFQCSHGSTLFYVNGTTGNTATKCLATAEWENENHCVTTPLPNTCEINNLNVVGSTTITCTVGNGVCGGGTTSITQHITVVPKTNNTATIVGAVLGSIIAILLIIITFLVV